MEVLVFVVPILMCAAVSIGIGMYSIKKKTPIHFFAGTTTVKSEEISNVKAYNKANGIMWIAYGSTFILSAILAMFFGSKVGAIILVVSSSLEYIENISSKSTGYINIHFFISYHFF